MNSKDCAFTINFAPQQFLQEAETKLKQSFRWAIDAQVRGFFEDKKVHTSKGLEHVTGPGALLVSDWLEKKFDDPKTQEYMDKYFETNFTRMFDEALQKALERKANKIAFTKVEGNKDAC